MKMPPSQAMRLFAESDVIASLNLWKRFSMLRRSLPPAVADLFLVRRHYVLTAHGHPGQLQPNSGRIRPTHLR